MDEPLTETLELDQQEDLSIAEQFKRALDSDSELRAALEAYDVDSLTDEAKEQILDVYNQVGAAGLAIEVDEPQQDEEQVAEVDRKF